MGTICFIYRSGEIYQCEPPYDLIYSDTKIPLKVAIPWYPPKIKKTIQCFLCFSPRLQEVYLWLQSEKQIFLLQSYMDLQQVFAKCKIKIGDGLLDFLTTYAKIGILIYPDINGQEKITITSKEKLMPGVNFACPTKILNKLFLKELNQKEKETIEKILKKDSSPVGLFLADALNKREEEISKALFFQTNWLATLPAKQKKIIQNIVFTNRGILWKV